MPNRQIELALKRGRLQERIASQRATLAAQVRPVTQALETADRGLAMARSGLDYIKHHPGQVGAAVVVLAVLRPGRVWRWGRRAFVAWGVWNRLRNRLENSGFSRFGARFSTRRGAA